MATLTDWTNMPIPGHGEDVGVWDAAMRNLFVDFDMRDAGYLNAMGAPYRAVGNNSTDDTSALQACLSDAQTRGLRMYIPPVIGSAYKISGTLATAQSFVQPQVRMAGPEVCKIRSTAAAPIFRFVGGSGRFSRGGVYFGNLEGSAATAVELQGACGMTVKGCKLTTLAGGVLMHNLASGSFSEFNVVEDCNCESSVVLPLEYRVGSGGGSFHGSGFRQSVFSQPSGATGPQVKIGAGARVYSAPWDGTFFAAANTGLVLNQGYPAQVLGDLCFEAPNTISCPFVNPASTAQVLHGGHVSSLGEGVYMGSMYVPIDRVQANTNGTFSSLAKETTQRITLASGTVSLGSREPGKAALVSVHVEGPFYEYIFLVFFNSNPLSSGGIATVIASHAILDQNGVGVPTFAVAATSPGQLTITKAAYSSSFTASLGFVDMGSNYLAPLA